MRSLVLIVVQFVVLATITVLIFPHYPRWHGFDLQHYHNIALSLRDGSIPYQDFLLEYPPGALVPIFLPQLLFLSTPLNAIDYALVFVIQNLIFTASIAVILASIVFQRTSSILLKYIILTIAIAPLLPWRYDLFPTLLTAIALWGVRSRSPIISGIALGGGIVAKLYPVVLVPVFCLYYFSSHQIAAAVRMGIAAIATTILTFVPFWWLAPDTVFSFLTYHKDRGFQIESLYSGVVILGNILGLNTASTETNYGAHHLVFELSEPLLKLQPWIFLGSIAIVYILALFRFRQASRTGEISIGILAVYCVAALLAFILTNKVFSPQYLIWLLPFLPFLHWRFFAIATISFILTTTVSFVTRRLRLMYPPSAILLNLRNLSLLVVWLTLLVRKR